MASTGFRLQAPRANEADATSTSRKNNRFVASAAIEPSDRTTRMKWLYNIITNYSLEYELSEPAREWVKQRIATEDVSSRRDRSYSTWWENANPHQSVNSLKAARDDDSSSSVSLSKRNTVTDIPKLSFEQVIANTQLISDFRDLLDDAYGAHNIDFLEMINAWHQDLSELQDAGKQKEYEQCMYDRVLSIYTQFVNRATAGDNLINVSDAIRNDIGAKVTTMVKRGRSKIDLTQIDGTLFNEAIAAVHVYTRENVWPDFAATEDYIAMCQGYAEALELAQRSPNRSTAITGGSSSGTDYAHNVGLPNFPILFPQRSQSWVNTEGFHTLTVSVTAGRGPMVGGKKANDLALVVGAGSRMFKSPTAPGSWNETFYLPVDDTLQYAFVCVVQSGKCVGFVPLPMVHLINSPTGTGARWYSLRTEDNPGEMVMSDGVLADGDTAPSAVSASGGNEVLLSWKLGNETCPSTLEKMKVIYADETATGGFGDFIRGKVSKKKKRFAEDNFNLDLTYITPQVIAMGFPSEGTEGMYRNPLKQVQQFFLLRHPHAYRIYNLCSERAYDTSKFEYRCEHHPFDDHNPPPFRLIKDFCESARVFLMQSPQNVISVHCKAGKGRTGTMIACYFVYCGMGTAQEALSLFGKMRTSNSKGVTIPSQIRYVHYFDHYCRLRRAGKPAPGKTTLFIDKVIVHGLGKSYGASDLQFTLLQPNKMVEETNNVVEESKPRFFTSRKLAVPTYYKAADNYVWDLRSRVVDVCEDFRVEVYARTGLGGREKLFHCWLNSRFLQLDPSNGELSITIPKAELDKACKDTKHKKYSADMYLQLVFGNVATATRIKNAELTA